MDKKTSRRCAGVTERFFNGLGTRFFLNNNPRDGRAFTVDQKVAPYTGPDGMPCNMKKWPGPTYKQMEVMSEVSPTDEEFIGNLKLLIFENKDVTKGAIASGQAASADEIRSIAAEEARKMLAGMLADIQAGQLTLDQAKAQVNAKAEQTTAPVKKGLQADDTPNIGMKAKARGKHTSSVRKKEIEVYTARGRTLGLLKDDETAPLRPSDKWVTAKFRKRVDAMWDEQTALEKAEEPAAAE